MTDTPLADYRENVAIEQFQRLVARLPGGHLIGESWRLEPRQAIEITVDTIPSPRRSTFGDDMLLAILALYAPTAQADEHLRLMVHPIAAELLEFWYDDESDYRIHYPEFGDHE